jgi:hypothetical protein
MSVNADKFLNEIWDEKTDSISWKALKEKRKTVLFGGPDEEEKLGH